MKIKKRVSMFLIVCMVISTACTVTATDSVKGLKDDFYAAVNASWLESAFIPSDSPVVGGFTELSDEIDALLMADFAAMLEGTKAVESDALANFIEYYRLAIDFGSREESGMTPLLPYMRKVEALSSLEELSQWAQLDLDGFPLPFVTYVAADWGNASVNAVYLLAPSLFLMDKTYYADESTKQILQEADAQMTINLLVMAGKTEEEAKTITAQAIAFDESLAPYTLNAQESSDLTKRYNKVPLAELDRQVETFDFSSSITALVGACPDTVIVADPEYFAVLDLLVNESTFQNLKSWMLVQLISGFSNFLTEEFRVESGSFSRMLFGTSEPVNKEMSAYYLASSAFSEVVGIYYGQTYFGEEAKRDVKNMVKELLSVYESRLKLNAWLTESTKTMAIKKLQTMHINVGYPDAAQPVYDKLVTVPAEQGGSLVSNAINFSAIIKQDMYSQWDQPVDRSHWPLSADTINAMYSATNNSINFPAAILQAPFYSTKQSASANYGGIGAVIAHEISHAFDPNGSKFDEFGSLNEWWTKEDYAKFEELSQDMVTQFDGIAYAGSSVNGTLTVAENVADAGGLACALAAAKNHADVDLAAFFTNWAVIWRQKANPEYEALLLNLDVHAPNKVRANRQLQNMDDFYTTFDIKEGDKMYCAPEDRVIIW